MEVLGSEHYAGDGLGVEGDGDILRAGVVVHAEVEPDNNVLTIDALVVEELGEVLLGLEGQVNVLPRVAIGLVVVVLGDGEVRLEDVGGVLGEGGVVGAEVDVAAAGHEAVTAGDTPGVLLLVVDDAEHALAVLGPVELLLLLHVVGLELHLLELAELGEPGLGLVDDDEIGALEGVLGGDDIEIGLPGENVVVERTLGAKADTSAKVGLVLVVGGRLEIAGSADLNLDGAVNVESIVEEVVVVTNGGDGAGMESRALDGGNVGETVGVATAAISVTGNGVSGVRLEEADTLGVDIGDIVGGVGDVQHGGSEGAVEPLDESGRGGTDGEVSVVVDSVGSLGLVASILSSSLLERELVDDALTLELDVVEHETEDASEGHVERPAHELNILVLAVELVALATNLNALGSNAVVKVTDTHLRDSLEKGPLLVTGLGELADDLASLEGLAELIGSLEELGVGDIAAEGVLGDVGAGDVENDVEVNGSDVAGGTRVSEHNGDPGLGAIERVGTSVGSDNVGAGVAGTVVGTIEESLGDVGDISHGLLEERLIASGALAIHVATIVGDLATKAAVEGVVVRGDGGLSTNRKGANHVLLRDRLLLAALEDDDTSILGRLSCIAVDVAEDLGLVEVQGIDEEDVVVGQGGVGRVREVEGALRSVDKLPDIFDILRRDGSPGVSLGSLDVRSFVGEGAGANVSSAHSAAPEVGFRTSRDGGDGQEGRHQRLSEHLEGIWVREKTRTQRKMQMDEGVSEVMRKGGVLSRARHSCLIPARTAGETACLLSLQIDNSPFRDPEISGSHIGSLR